MVTVVPRMTRVAVAASYGGPDVIEIVERELPEPSEGQVLVEVKAIGVNPFDYKSYSGAFGTDGSKLPIALGSEASGIVVAVGGTVEGPVGPVAVGDAVVVSGQNGTYAERILVPARFVFPKPEALDWNVAAGVLAVAGTAYDALESVGVESGDTVLVHGAAGGVGSVVAQLALERGATVIGTARHQNHDALRAYGVEPVEYGDGLIDRVRAAAPNGVDAAIDTVGTDEAVDVSLELLTDRPRLVSTAAFGRASADGFLTVGGPVSMERRRLASPVLLEQAGAGVFEVTVAKTFPLADAARAHAELQSAHPRGKFVLIP
ncbi:Quinone oxidoreductase 1 [Rhodococcoides fascians]|uniref:Quinone oxidoreductase 1 n=2 Tax=Rhodococcoides fascians TaxID=1828 RepID=A0A143QFU7_RHOFA|nr:Quinone oxidoreductase 1 [Rhodococcus fascians]